MLVTFFIKTVRFKFGWVENTKPHGQRPSFRITLPPPFQLCIRKTNETLI